MKYLGFASVAAGVGVALGAASAGAPSWLGAVAGALIGPVAVVCFFASGKVL